MNRLPSPRSAVLISRGLLDSTQQMLAILCLMLLATLAFTHPVHAISMLYQDPYPAPELPEIAPVDDNIPSIDLAQPYPAPTTDVLGTVGEGAQTAPANGFPPDVGNDTGAVATTPQASQSGLYFLWGGFLAALLIFATAVVGSLVLFSRRVE